MPTTPTTPTPSQYPQYNNDPTGPTGADTSAGGAVTSTDTSADEADRSADNAVKTTEADAKKAEADAAKPGASEATKTNADATRVTADATKAAADQAVADSEVFGAIEIRLTGSFEPAADEGPKVFPHTPASLPREAILAATAYINRLDHALVRASEKARALAVEVEQEKAKQERIKNATSNYKTGDRLTPIEEQRDATVFRNEGPEYRNGPTRRTP